MTSYFYIYIDTLIGGGLVINGQPHAGLYGNEGAIGSMPLGVSDGTGAQRSAQLLGAASMVTLEEMLVRAGLADVPCEARILQAAYAAVAERWIVKAASAIAFPINSSACLLDLEGVIVDGALHGELLDKLLDEVRVALGRYSWQGVMRPQIHRGAIGADAKVRGAGYLPLHANFAPAHDLFLKLV